MLVYITVRFAGIVHQGSNAGLHYWQVRWDCTSRKWCWSTLLLGLLGLYIKEVMLVYITDRFAEANVHQPFLLLLQHTLPCRTTTFYEAFATYPLHAGVILLNLLVLWNIKCQILLTLSIHYFGVIQWDFIGNGNEVQYLKNNVCLVNRNIVYQNIGMINIIYDACIWCSIKKK